MTEGSETWELDSNGKVVDICGTREVLFFNFAHYPTTNSPGLCENLYGTEKNLFNAIIPDKNNRFNSWNFKDITLVDNDFLSLDKNELARERGPNGSLPEINFMKLNPEGPHYQLLKTIEEEMQNYEILSDGTIKKIINNENVTNNDDKNEDNNNNEDNGNIDNINNEDYNSRLGAGAISAIVIGILATISIAILIIRFYKRRKIKKEILFENESKTNKQSENIKNIKFESNEIIKVL